MSAPRRWTAVLALVLASAASGCSQTTIDMAEGVKAMVLPTGSHGYSSRDRECLMRAMFFESNRSSRDGLVAVGTVVMNRLRSGKHGETICAVVGEKGQFARGVMTRKMDSRSLPDVQAAADAVLRGERHPKVKNAMYFHTAGLKFPYKNMHYTVVAGGNAFYERRNRRGDPVVLPPEKGPRLWKAPEIMVAEASPGPAAATPPAVLASAREMPAAFDAPLAIAGNTPSRSPLTAPASLPDVAPAPSPEPQAVASAEPPPATLEARMADMPFGAAEASAPALSFDVDQSDADAIGAMIAGGY